MRFAGQRVLVIGGTGGIGAATVARFAEEGARIAVGARSQERFEGLSAELERGGLVPAIGPVGTQTECARVVKQALTALGGLDVLVNAAGVFEEVPVAETTQDHWDRHMGVNAGGTFFAIQAALPALRASKGNAVNVASDAGLIGYPLGAAYSAAKGAVVNLTRTLALELAPDVRVNCVCPGNVNTGMIARAAEAADDSDAYLRRANARAPLGRMAEPREVAEAILYLASKEAAFTNGAMLAVDGGGVCGF
ncbi:SDR family NAD(P)-dependent oxidoreductase [Arhodomonas sp. AD133]|uniref:SDR family NAD(P)-dependent oxidoreductase n=1 Tax=Arhodomonas sp. AD133 TaxID=3415009 RepID=UPI003EBBD206